MLQGRPDWGDFLTEGWGGGVLFDLGAHPIAIVLLLADAGPGGTDRVVEVRARLEGAPDVPVDVYADVSLTFASGLVARVETSWRETAAGARLPGRQRRRRGARRAHPPPGPRAQRARPWPCPTPGPGSADPRLDQFGYVTQLEDFLDDFAHDRRPEIGAEFGRLVLDITCAGYASAADDSRPVAVPFDRTTGSPAPRPLAGRTIRDARRGRRRTLVTHRETSRWRPGGVP